MYLIGQRTKRWVQPSGIQQGQFATQGWMSSFLLSRLSKAVRDSPMLFENVMCTTRVNLCRSIFCGSEMVHSYQPDPVAPIEFESISILLSALSAQVLFDLSSSPSALWLSGINRPLQRSRHSLEHSEALQLDIPTAVPGGDVHNTAA